jgi:hypothetical protein
MVDAVLCGATQSLSIHEKKSWCVSRTTSSRMLTAVSGRYTDTVTYTYDEAGRKSTEGLTIAGQTCSTTTETNDRGELVKYTYPDSTIVERDYTDRGELWKVKQDSTVIDTRTYDDGGRMLTSTYDNGVTDTRAYNSDNTLASIDFGGTGNAIGDLTYGWDANKNKTSETIAGVMSGYSFTVPTSGYDDEDRLVDFDGAADQVDQSWNLSLVGDWDSVTTDSTTQNRTHGPTHELLTAGGSSVSTDVKGKHDLNPSQPTRQQRPAISKLGLR